MKASLITIHTGANFGTVLQAIASVFVLKKNGLNVTIVNYIPPRSTYSYAISETKSLVKKASGFNKIIEAMRGGVKVYRLFNTNKVFVGTIKKYCTLSKKIYNEDCFAKKCPLADVYITGSDQVWNTYHNQGIDNHYFFSGVCGRKVSLASSIGMDALSDIEKKVYYQFLSEYEAISVREDRAVDILREIGIKAIHVLDPTLMLNRDEWYRTISFKRLIKPNYLLIYIPYNVIDKAPILEFAKRVAYEKSIKLVTFDGILSKEDGVDYVLKGVNPKGFLSLMYYADYVITNSFHGTAFSINMNRNFWIYMPSKFTSRIESLLDLCDLKGRIVNGNGEFLNIDDNINYDMVNSILDKERGKFNDYVSSIVKK